MNLRKLIFKYIVKHREQRSATFKNFDSVKNILIIFESDLTERHLQINQLIKELNNKGKFVSAWGYIERKHPITMIMRDFRVLGRANLDILNRPNKKMREDLQKMHFDMLIDLTTNPDILPLRYLTFYANADFKAGKGNYEEPYIHDFMIDMPEETANDSSRLFDQIIRYTSIIKSPTDNTKE